MEMECPPNCRNVEVGDWLFPSGYVPDADDHWNKEEILHAEMIEPNHLPEMVHIPSLQFCDIAFVILKFTAVKPH